jgi:hypothetical protein
MTDRNINVLRGAVRLVSVCDVTETPALRQALGKASVTGEE